MKYSITILIAIHCIFSYAQDYKEPFKKEICACLDTEMEDRKQIRNAFDACFNKKLPTYATIIDASVDEATPALKYQKGQLLRMELKLVFMSELVYSCDVYFQAIESERQRKLATGRSRTYPSDLEKWNQKVAMQPHPQSYMQRAQIHFYLGNLKEAEADVYKSLEVNPNGQLGIYTRKEKLLLAWILEEQKRYQEAVTMYEESYAGNFDIEVLILKAAAHKKAGGKYAKAMPDKTKPRLKEKEIPTKERTREVSRRRGRAGDSKPIETTKKAETEKKKSNENLRQLFKTKKAKSTKKTKRDNG